MTSRDLTENVEQLQVRRALVLVRGRMLAALARLAERAAEHADAGDDRPHPQRARAGHHAGQALRQRRRGAAAGAVPGRRPARPLPAAGRQGPGRHPAGHARPARRRRRAPRPARGPRSPSTSGSRPCSPTSARCTRARSTSTWSARWCRRPPARPTSPSPSASWPARSWPPRASGPGQVGSSAMPHKMNSRSCERIDGFLAILRGHLTMVGGARRRPVERGRRVAARSCAGSRCPTPSSPSTGCSRPSSPCSTTSAPTRRWSSASSTATCRSSPPPRC